MWCDCKIAHKNMEKLVHGPSPTFRNGRDSQNYVLMSKVPRHISEKFTLSILFSSYPLSSRSKATSFVPPPSFTISSSTPSHLTPPSALPPSQISTPPGSATWPASPSPMAHPSNLLCDGDDICMIWISSTSQSATCNTPARDLATVRTRFCRGSKSWTKESKSGKSFWRKIDFLKEVPNMDCFAR